MSTNATTWFYAEPETGRPYMITERVTHTFWANRLSDVFLQCTRAEAPYKVEGKWRDELDIEIEWEVAKYFKLRLPSEHKQLITVCSEVLGFRPSVSYNNSDGDFITEWYPDKNTASARLQELQGNPAHTNIRKHSR